MITNPGAGGQRHHEGQVQPSWLTAIRLTERDSIDYYALKWGKRSTFGELSEKSYYIVVKTLFNG